MHFPYTCTFKYCSCPAFINIMMAQPHMLYCKHILAAQLSACMQKVKVTEVHCEKWAELFALDRNRIKEQYQESLQAAAT
mmetsp:Transcript_18199/g.25594  ORF Transcript_18199/g.25594 Transcript_18199/m.25594 type:complete len:80 (-) Transcript_18199:245-484(-)